MELCDSRMRRRALRRLPLLLAFGRRCISQRPRGLTTDLAGSEARLQAGGMVVFDGYANHRIYVRTASSVCGRQLIQLSNGLCVLMQECTPPRVLALWVSSGAPRSMSLLALLGARLNMSRCLGDLLGHQVTASFGRRSADRHPLRARPAASPLFQRPHTCSFRV